MLSNHQTTAPRLQKSPGMRWLVVAILALGALAGCGVGVDDGPLPQPAGVSAQALEESAPPVQLGETTTNPRANAALDGGSSVALPQDPIPLLVVPVLPVQGPAPFGPPVGGGLPPLPTH